MQLSLTFLSKPSPDSVKKKTDEQNESFNQKVEICERVFSTVSEMIDRLYCFCETE